MRIHRAMSCVAKWDVDAPPPNAAPWKHRAGPTGSEARPQPVDRAHGRIGTGRRSVTRARIHVNTLLADTIKRSRRGRSTAQWVPPETRSAGRSSSNSINRFRTYPRRHYSPAGRSSALSLCGKLRCQNFDKDLTLDSPRSTPRSRTDRSSHSDLDTCTCWTTTRSPHEKGRRNSRQRSCIALWSGTRLNRGSPRLSSLHLHSLRRPTGRAPLLHTEKQIEAFRSPEPMES